MPTPRRISLLAVIAAGLVLAALAYAFIAWYPGAPAQWKNAVGVPTAGQVAAGSFGSAHASDLLTYTDPVYGFKLHYPQGYLALADPDPGVHVRFIADFPFSSSEVIDVAVTNTSTGEADFAAAQKSFNASEITSLSQDVVNGRPAYFIAAVVVHPDTNETLYIRQSFLSCPAATAEPGVGDYWVEETAVIPEALAGDVPLAEYMEYGLTC